jgi:hypothetical protein
VVNGITFSEQLITSENFAHFMYTFLNHANGVTKGCAISNANGKVYVQKGYFIVFGRMVQIIGTEEIASPDVVSGQLYCKVVFEVDLSKENTAEEFIQGVFKTLTSTASYPSVRQEDLDDTGKVYQMPWCQYIKQAGAIKDFRDLREILDLNSIWSAISSQNTQYKGEFDDYFAAQRSTILGMIAELEGQGYATTAEFNDLSAEVAETKKSVSDGKALVAAAITAKRVATAATATFKEMAANIGRIVLGSGNAQPADVLAGKTATNDSGVEFMGTMPNNPDVTTAASTILYEGSLYYRIPKGAYINLTSNGYPEVKASQATIANAIGLNPDYMLDSINVLGKQGKIQSMAGVTITPQTYAQTVWSAWKRMTGNVEIAAVPLPPASVVKKGYRYWIGSSYVDGTCEGYFPTANDLYLHGNNPANFSCSSGSGYVTFFLDHIEIRDTSDTKIINASIKFNLTGHANLKIDGEFCNGASSGRYLDIYRGSGTGWYSFAQHIFAGSACTGRTTITIPLPANLGDQLIGFRFGSSITGNIYHVWLE